MLSIYYVFIKIFYLCLICAIPFYAYFLYKILISSIQHVWHDLANRILLRRTTLKEHCAPIVSARWSIDRTYVTTRSEDNTILTWTIRTGKQVAIPLSEGESIPHDLLASPDNCSVAMGIGTCMLSVKNSLSGKLEQMLHGHTQEITACAWSNDGSHIITASRDGTSRIWNVATGSTVHSLHDIYDTFFVTTVIPGATAQVLRLCISPDGQQIATGSILGTVALWSQISGTIQERLTDHTGSIQALSFSPDGTMVASASTDETVRIWNPKNGQLLATFTGHVNGAHALAFAPLCDILITADGNGSLYVWSIKNKKQLRVIHEHTTQITCLTFHPDGDYLLSASAEGKACIWKI